MNEQIINELLEQLKSNLENVESAKKQVEDTVGAYNTLEGQVDGFVRELGYITQNTHTIIEQLEEVKKNFLSNVSTNLENIITQGVESINSNVNSAKEIELQQSTTIISNVNTSETNIATKITTESTAISNAIGSSMNTVVTGIQNTRTNIASALSNSEQRILQLVNDRVDVIQSEINSSEDSIKGAVHWAVGICVIILLFVIIIFAKS